MSECKNSLCLDLDPRLFKALSEPNRISIIKRLAERNEPCTVSQINECCPINISVVSRHLASLRDAGIVEAEKKGKEVYYAIRYSELVKTLRAIADAIENCCPSDCCQNVSKAGNEKS